jgi:hypothetical protein
MKTRQLTQGAMATALFGLLLLVNQQTSLTIETSMSWIFVFPILVFTAMYGPKVSGAAAIAMGLMSFLFGGFTTWFYSWISIAMGYLYGTGVYYQWPSFQRLAATFLVSLVSNFCVLFLMAAVFGIDYAEDMQLLQTYAPYLHLSTYIAVLVVFSAILETAVIHMLAILVLKRLKIKTVPMKNILQMQPSRLVGILSLVLWIGAFAIFANGLDMDSNAGNILFVLLILDCFILLYYGVLWFFYLAVRTQKRLLAMISVLGAFIPGLNLVWMLVGELDALFGLRVRKEGVV